jgi:hypothetical protein
MKLATLPFRPLRILCTDILGAASMIFHKCPLALSWGSLARKVLLSLAELFGKAGDR